jgi:hypothetical protein
MGIPTGHAESIDALCMYMKLVVVVVVVVVVVTLAVAEEA